MPPTKKSSFEVNVPDEIATSISSIALGMMNAMVYHQGPFTILAKKGSSFRSFGELIEIQISSTRSDSSKIVMVSKSALPTTLIDWGTNAENAQRFEQLVKQLIKLVHLLEKQRA